MAVPNSSYDQVTAITEKHYMPNLREVIFTSNVVLSRLHKKGPFPSSGTQIHQPLAYQAGNGGAYNPRGEINIAQVDQITSADFNWKYYVVPISYFRDEILKNAGPEGKKSLLDTKMMVARKEMIDDISTDMYATGTSYYGDSAIQLNSLIGACGNAAYPTTTITYGGIQKSAANAFWHGYCKDNGTTDATIANMETVYINLSRYGGAPNLIIAEPIQFAVYWNLMGAYQRFVTKNVDGFGWDGLLFNTTPVIMEPKCNIANMFFLQTDYLHLVSHKKENVRLDPFQKPITQNAAVGKIYWAGNLTCSDCRRQGVLYDFT